ncbi:MAG: YCF48-related protein [Pirellulaceae bacterium]
MRTLPTVSRIFTLLLCCLSVSNQADSATVFQDDADLLDVCAVDAQHVWAVGSRGTILHSADGGTTWEFQNANVDCRLETVHFVDAKTGWCAGGYSQPITHKGVGVLLATTDGGLTWNRIGDDFLPWLKRIHFLNEQQGFAIGHSTSVYASGIFRTSDGGTNWTPVIARTSSAPQDTSFLSDGSGWILNDDGQLSSLQKGQLQSVFRFGDLPQKPWIESIAFQQYAAVAVGAHGTILHSADLGRTWQPATIDSNVDQRSHPKHVHWTDVQFINDTAFAISGGTEIAISTDSGRSWQTSSTQYSLPLHAVAMADQQTGWAVGAFGGILKTSTGGKQWEPQRIPQRQASIFVVMPDVQHLPLPAFAKLATEEGLYTVVQPLAQPPEVDSTDRLNVPAAWRTAAALDGLAVSLQPPMGAVSNPHPSWEGSRETVAKYWQTRTGNDNILAQWAVDLAVRIRLFRPAAILTSQQFDNSPERQTQDAIASAHRIGWK